MIKLLKKTIYLILKIYELSIGKLLYIAAKRYASFHTKLMHYADWYFNDTSPSSYKHEINLYNWIYDPTQSQFVEGGVFGRMLIEKDNNILDLCCGDGSYSYLFFSDIAKHVDAIDYDKDSIHYAKKMYSKKNINYICNNILTYELKSQFYDVIVFKSGVAYFTQKDRKILFTKIYNALANNGKLYVGTPLEDTANFSANQIEVVINENDFEKEFDSLFEISFKQKTFYKNRTTIHYILKRKRNIEKLYKSS